MPEIEESDFHDSLGDDFDGDTKPVFLLDNFSFFDPSGDKNELFSLPDLEEDDGISNRQWEGVGDVRPNIELDDEDAGQEDDLDEDQTRVRLSAIWRYTVDYTKRDQ